MSTYHLSRRIAVPAVVVAALLLSVTAAWALTTQRISYTPNHGQFGGHCVDPAINDDGATVLFTCRQVWLRGRLHPNALGCQTWWNYIDPALGWQETAKGFQPAINADGQFVAFASDSRGILPLDVDQNNSTDVFLRDSHTPVTIAPARASVNWRGRARKGDSYSPAIDGSGRWVAFVSEADLVVHDTNGSTPDVFVYDAQAGTSDIVPRGGGQPGPSRQPDISSDGLHIAYQYTPPGSPAAIRTYNRSTRESRTITNGNGPSGYPSIGADGRYVAFESDATDIVPGDTNGCTDVFVYDCQTGRATRVSVGSNRDQGNDFSARPSISGDGRLVAFHSPATNLVADDTNGCRDIFVHDRHSRRTFRVSVATDGTQANGHSYNADFSGDGTCVAYESDATDLTTGDTNGYRDIYVGADLSLPQPQLKWAGASGYVSDGVEPDTGPAGTSFEFKVKYTDPSGADPLKAACRLYRRVGPAWEFYRRVSLSKESGDVSSGAIYGGTTALGNFPWKHRFCFEAGDGAPVVGYPPCRNQHGPTITDSAPRLYFTGQPGYEDDGVNPDAGAAGTEFIFTVLYQDSDGQTPEVAEVVVKRDGRLYKRRPMIPGQWNDHRIGKVYNRHMKITQSGAYTYRFHFIEGGRQATGPPASWSTGPIVTETGLLVVTSLSSIPTRIGAQLTFTLSSSASVTATVLNVAGRPIRTVAVDEPLDAGLQTLLWDRKGNTGLAVPSGLYLVRLTARTESGAQSNAVTPLSVP